MVGYLKNRLAAFVYAFNGIITFFKDGFHAKVHALAIFFVSSLGYYLEISRQDWINVILCFGLVISLEAINSAIEYSLDLLHPDQHPLVKKAKDVAAGAVLLAALASIVIAVIIFKPYLGWA